MLVIQNHSKPIAVTFGKQHFGKEMKSLKPYKELVHSAICVSPHGCGSKPISITFLGWCYPSMVAYFKGFSRLSLGW